MKRGLQLLGSGVLALSLLSGCSSGQAPIPGPQDSGSQDSGSPAAEGPAENGTSATEQGTGTAGTSGASVSETGDPIVSQTIKAPGTANEVEIAVHSLKVHGKLMELSLVLTPNYTSGPEVTSGNGILYTSMTGTSLEAPKLLDREFLKEYKAVKQPKLTESMTRNKLPLLYTAWYAAPEDPVETFDVLVSSAIPAFLDVPVTR